MGGRLIAAYALGSLAHGGFSELVSDVDLGLIVSEPLRLGDRQTIQAVADMEKAKGSALSDRLSVFWGSPATLRAEQTGGRFPALDRLDLIENGRLLAGTDDVRLGLPRPGRSELLVAGAEFALDYLSGIPRSPDRTPSEGLRAMSLVQEDAVEEILFPDLLIERGVRRLTKIVLFPARFIYSAATGRVGTNDVAVVHYLSDNEAPSRGLVAAALAWRTAPPQDRASTAELLGAQLLPLYHYYIDDHIKRLYSIDELSLARAFEEWRNQLGA
jgi:hypothetical protein